MPSGASLRTCPQINDIAPLIGGKVFPQAAPCTVKFNDQTLASVAVDVADVELAPPDVSQRKQVMKDRLKPMQ